MVDMAVAKYIFLLLCIACLACSPERQEAKDQSALCRLSKGGSNVSRVGLSGVYLFGDYQHGISAVDESCPDGIISARIAKRSVDGTGEDKLQSLRNDLYFAPKIKSGMFKVYGAARVDSDRGS